MELRRGRTLGAWILVICLPGGCTPVGGGASDVPCLVPTAWPDGALKFLMRGQSEGASLFLLAHQTSDQSRNDREDGITGNDAIGPVYRFDPESGGFSLVDRTAWDAAEGPVQTCIRSIRRPTAFQITGFTTQTLEFDGRTVPVQGGKALRIERAPSSLAAAVISATGGSGIPLFSAGGGSGQHYHQLFSEVDGSPIGDAVRIGVGAGIAGNPVYGCWTDDEKHIVYVDTGDDVRFQRICIVPITDPLPQADGESGAQEESP